MNGTLPDKAIDFLEKQCRRLGRPVELTNAEFCLLHFLLSIDGRVARKRIIDLVRRQFSYRRFEDAEFVLHNLRKKIEVDPARLEFIV